MKKAEIVTEKWRKSEYFDDFYRVSDLGRFKTIDHYVKYTKRNGKHSTYLKKGHILKLQSPPKAKGYVVASGYKNGKLNPKKIHIVVAKAFPEICGEWFEGAVVDHIDGNKKNNVAYNLRVCTIQQNNANPITLNKQKEIAKKIGKEKIGENNPMFEKHGKDNPNSKPILCITNNTYYENAIEASKILGLNANSIRRVCRGERTHTHRFVFEYVN